MAKGMGLGMRNGNLLITGHVASKGTCYCYCIRLSQFALIMHEFT